MASASRSLPEGRLRAPGVPHPFEILLLEPEIPPNTGNIARLCAATGCPLHLVGKLGFRIDEHAVRRAGLDYWPLVHVEHHADLQAARAAVAGVTPNRIDRRWWLFSGKATRSVFDAELHAGDVFVFGKESVGLPETLLREHPEDVVGIPTLGAVRSLNIANAASIALYEGLRQIGALRVDPSIR